MDFLILSSVDGEQQYIISLSHDQRSVFVQIREREIARGDT